MIIPEKNKIFAVFDHIKPEQVSCVLFGEDPYPRLSSACGIAFWDKEVNSWNDKTNGNSLKNILKAALVEKGFATYESSIQECRLIAGENDFLSPPELFELWLDQGILLINSALTFSGSSDKKEHLIFWYSFHSALINTLNIQIPSSPFYILWGKKAQKWEVEINRTIDDRQKIIKQGHPTFIHQFLDKDQTTYSPFSEIIRKTALSWY
jgi:uracil-DNA glycosylase